MRLLRPALLLAVVLCIPFIVWGGQFERWFTGDAAVQWLRERGPWGWLATIALLIADLVLPVPSTGVMSAAGYLYGAGVGGALSATGSYLAGMLAYGLSRFFREKAAARLASADDLASNASLFQRHGPWLVALSRALPLLPEVSCCLAGLAPMRFATFAIALACGCVPVGFAYAAIGAAGQENPALAIGLGIAVPAVLWFVVRRKVARTFSPRTGSNAD
jgi:uncharacterized membrane protein YdjX (TVP38/TMEM64 family)